MAICTGRIAWEPHGHRIKSVGYEGRVKVAEILKIERRAAKSPEVFRVLVLGTELPHRFETIEAARRAGEDALSVAGRNSP
jgi:hypothetical protein